LRLVWHREKAAARGGLAGEFLAELAKFYQAGARVVRKVPLGQRAKTVKLLLIGL
jgi:hypothetical protein